MYTRRISTFLLGLWIGVSLFVSFFQIQNSRSPDLVLTHPTAPAAKLLEGIGRPDAQLLLHHLAMEQVRDYTSTWEVVEMVLAIALGFLLFIGTKKRLFPLVLCGVMLAMVLFEHFALTPELMFQGRDTDFPPGNTAVAAVGRVWALQQMYAGVEIVKLIAGGVLASFLFAYQSSRRRTARSSESIDHTLHGHVNRM